jgi:hypothetical protein
MDRTIEKILADWRAAEARLEREPSNVDLQELVSALRDEHAMAMVARNASADELREYPARAVT